MKSAAAYTNKRRVSAEASNNKVQYPGNVARNSQSLAPACPINPNFQVLNYIGISLGCQAQLYKQITVEVITYDGGSSSTEASKILLGSATGEVLDAGDS